MKKLLFVSRYLWPIDWEMLRVHANIRLFCIYRITDVSDLKQRDGWTWEELTHKEKLNESQRDCDGETDKLPDGERESGGVERKTRSSTKKEKMTLDKTKHKKTRLEELTEKA